MRTLLGRNFGGLTRQVRRSVFGVSTRLRQSAVSGMTSLRTSTAPELTSIGSTGRWRKQIDFGFYKERHVVLECAGTLHIKVVASQITGRLVELTYATVEGTAKAGERFEHVEGTLIFGPNQTEKFLRVNIIDNDRWDPDEEFYVELQDLRVKGSRSWSALNSRTSKNSPDQPRGANNEFLVLGKTRTTIKVLDDDDPDTLGFEVDEVLTHEGEEVQLKVQRSGGTWGRIECSYVTSDGSAIAHKDYQPVKGTLVFEDGETEKLISIPILVSQNHQYENDEVFSVILNEASFGVRFGDSMGGQGSGTAVCDVIIAGGDSRSCLLQLIRRLFNLDRTALGLSLWSQQFRAVMYCNGSPEEQAEATWVDWVFHVLTLWWRLMFLLVPPPFFLGGWACFWMALVMIGLVTAYVGDIALLAGCCIGLPDQITAITIVALGTSLPDTLASKTAAQQDDTADNSIGNILGSNCVNVFLGLGFSWTIGAAYWKITGSTPEWKKQLAGGKTYEEICASKDGAGCFIVPSGALLFSVCLYSCFALVCMALFIFRRHRYGGELGGPQLAQKRDSLALVFLWLAYIVSVSVYSALYAD